MSQLADSAPTRDLAVQDREERDDRHEPFPRSARLRALVEALGYAGAIIDPTGLLARQRFLGAEDEEQRHGRR